MRESSSSSLKNALDTVRSSSIVAGALVLRARERTDAALISRQALRSMVLINIDCPIVVG